MCAANQAKTLTLDETFDFQIKLVGWKGIEYDNLDELRKKDFTENELEEVNAQACASGIDMDKCTRVREVSNPSRSLISKSIRLRRKIRFQERGGIATNIQNGEVSNCDDSIKSWKL